MKFKGEVGVQLATHQANQHSTPELVRLAQLAYDKGIERVWVDDNLRFRNVFVLMSAIASKVPISLGSAIIVPYFRNPIDTADALAALSELTAGKELSVGISRGSTGIVPFQIDTEPPIVFMREIAVLLKSLFAGKEVVIDDFPHIRSYYRFKKNSRFKIAFPSRSPIKLYHGCSGIQAARLAGEVMDGILISGLYVALLRTGRVKRIIESASSSSKEFVKACEINISMSKDRERALQDPKAFLTHVIPGSYDALGLIEPLGIDKKKVEILKERLSRGIAYDELKGMISDDDVKKCYIAGSPGECREQLLDALDQTAKLGFERICFKLGPDYKETIELLGDEIIPELKGG